MDSSTKGENEMWKWLKIKYGWWRLDREMAKLNKIAKAAKKRAEEKEFVDTFF